MCGSSLYSITDASGSLEMPSTATISPLPTFLIFRCPSLVAMICQIWSLLPVSECCTSCEFHVVECSSGESSLPLFTLTILYCAILGGAGLGGAAVDGRGLFDGLVVLSGGLAGDAVTPAVSRVSSA